MCSTLSLDSEHAKTDWVWETGNPWRLHYQHQCPEPLQVIGDTPSTTGASTPLTGGNRMPPGKSWGK